MALRGNLRDITIVQILNIINLAKKTGALVIKTSNDQSQIIFREGKLIFAKMGAEDNGLPAILQRGKKISHNQARLLKEKAGNMTDKQLGLLLINAGYVSQKDVLECLQDYYLSVVRRYFNWVEGEFAFEQNVLPPPDKIPVKIDLENLIMEGSRRMKEWEHLQEEIPSLEMAVRFADRPGSNLRNLTLSLEEWRVVKYVNPKNTLRQIARATNLNDLEIRKVIYSLLEAGIIELIRPDGTRFEKIPSILSTKSKEEQRSLVTRLIDRIRSI